MLRQALDALKAQPEVNTEKLAAIGFVMVVKVVLDLARSGADLKAVVTFHEFKPESTCTKGKIQAEILVLHGEIDTMVSLDDVASFRQEMHRCRSRS